MAVLMVRLRRRRVYRRRLMSIARGSSALDRFRILDRLAVLMGAVMALALNANPLTLQQGATSYSTDRLGASEP